MKGLTFGLAVFASVMLIFAITANYLEKNQRKLQEKQQNNS